MERRSSGRCRRALDLALGLQRLVRSSAVGICAHHRQAEPLADALLDSDTLFLGRNGHGKLPDIVVKRVWRSSRHRPEW
jgi:hypothetical protein